jgi:hypothetical protein
MYSRLCDVALTCRIPFHSTSNNGEGVGRKGAVSQSGAELSHRLELLRCRERLLRHFCHNAPQLLGAPSLIQFLKHRNHRNPSLTGRLHHAAGGLAISRT